MHLEPRVLLARIRTQLRRLRDSSGSEAPVDDQVLRVGPMQVDVAARAVSIDGHEVALTTMEFEVLRMLASHAGSVVEREELYSRVLGTEYDGLDRGMDVHVSRIRRKLQRFGFDPGCLESVRGVGYLLVSR